MLELKLSPVQESDSRITFYKFRYQSHLMRILLYVASSIGSLPNLSFSDLVLKMKRILYQNTSRTIDMPAFLIFFAQVPPDLFLRLLFHHHAK